MPRRKRTSKPRIRYKSIRVHLDTWEKLTELKQGRESYDTVIKRLITTSQEPGIEANPRIVEWIKARAAEKMMSVDTILTQMYRFWYGLYLAHYNPDKMFTPGEKIAAIINKYAWYMYKIAMSVGELRGRISPDKIAAIRNNIAEIKQRLKIDIDFLNDAVEYYVQNRSRDAKVRLNESTVLAIMKIMEKMFQELSKIGGAK